MRQLPSHLHDIARHAERRAQLERQVQAAILVGRIRALCRKAARIIADVEFYAIEPGAPQQPTMAWFAEPGQRPFRSQPRNGRGRFLSKAWLAEAELFTNADRAWFRHPVSTEG